MEYVYKYSGSAFIFIGFINNFELNWTFWIQISIFDLKKCVIQINWNFNSKKLEQRIKKFGVQSENAKLSLRAQRFGQEVKSEDEGDKEKLKEKRAQRFGITTSPSKTVANGASAETLEKRAKRFGTTATTDATIEVRHFKMIWVMKFS